MNRETAPRNTAGVRTETSPTSLPVNDDELAGAGLAASLQAVVNRARSQNLDKTNPAAYGHLILAWQLVEGQN